MNRGKEMKILGYKGISWVSKTIRWQTRSVYSHVAIELSDGRVIEAWHKGGVRVNRDFGARHTPETEVDVFIIEKDFNELKVMDFLTPQIGKKYDFWSIVKFLTRRNEPVDDKWFCSEIVMQAFIEGGLHLLRRIPPSHVDPGHLLTSPYLKLAGSRQS